MRKKLDVSELGKGQCDQDMMSEQTNKWTVGRDVAGVGDRARSWVFAKSHDIGAATIARLWVRRREERCKNRPLNQTLRGDPGASFWNNLGKGPSS